MIRKLSALPLYVEDEAFSMPSVFLEEDVYAKALQAFVFVCTDALIINKEQETVFLARRKSRPMQNKWWFIGGRRRAGELPLASMQRCFKRETGLTVAAERFWYLTTNEYLFVDRQQLPYEAGTHGLVQTFCVELGAQELSSVRLDPDEYDQRGLVNFRFADLHSIPDVPAPVRDVCNLAFA